MKLIFYIFTIALVAGHLNARPADDFSIDMYSGSGHLRYERSTENEKATSGTVLTVEKPAENAQAKETATTKVEKEPLKIQDALKLMKNTIDKLEAEKKTPETDQVSQKKSESTSSSSISHPKYENTVHTEEMTILPNKPRYMNKYGDVLYKLNRDQVNTLSSSKQQEPAFRLQQQIPSSARLLTTPTSKSRVIMGGVELGSNTFVRGFNALKNNPSNFMGENVRGYGHGGQFGYNTPSWENRYQADSDARMLNFSPYRRY